MDLQTRPKWHPRRVSTRSRLTSRHLERTQRVNTCVVTKGILHPSLKLTHQSFYCGARILMVGGSSQRRPRCRETVQSAAAHVHSVLWPTAPSCRNSTLVELMVLSSQLPQRSLLLLIAQPNYPALKTTVPRKRLYSPWSDTCTTSGNSLDSAIGKKATLRVLNPDATFSHLHGIS